MPEPLTRSFDVLAIGRVGVDLYPMQTGKSLEDVTTFGKFLGGSAGNVAVAVARLGHTCALVSRTGNDPFGRFVTRALAELGVDPTYVTIDPSLPTPVTFCEIFPPDHFPLYFYRYPQAPDLRVTPEEIAPVAVRESRLFWATLTGLSAEPSRTAHATAWQLRERRPHTVIDLDYRPQFWRDESEATRAAGAAIEASTVAIGNLEECRVAVGTERPRGRRQGTARPGRGARRRQAGAQGRARRVGVRRPPRRAPGAHRGRQRPRRRRRLRRRLLPRPARGLGPRAHAALRQQRRRHRRLALECSTAMPTEREVLDLMDGASA